MHLKLLASASLLIVVSFPGYPRQPAHIDFSLVRGTVGFVSSTPNSMMTDAPDTVLSFTSEDGHTSLVLTEHIAGDYGAVLQPGHYCVAAYELKSGDSIPLDSRQLKCIDVTSKKDVRLDVMLSKHGSATTPD